jgi:hypothetical protein
MGIERTDWAREATLLRPARLTLALYQSAPALDASRPWVPDHLLPLYGGEAFASLTLSQRLRYNHAYARQLVDEFIWTERVLILAPLKQLCLTRALDPDQSAVLRSFMSDEVHHIERCAVAQGTPVPSCCERFRGLSLGRWPIPQVSDDLG